MLELIKLKVRFIDTDQVSGDFTGKNKRKADLLLNNVNSGVPSEAKFRPDADSGF